MNKNEQLDQLKKKMSNDGSLPLKKGTTNLVFGVGDPNTKILFIGEGPGYFEDQKGEPFVGNAGKLLDRLLESISIKREDVYITNVVHHRPPNNRDPESSELEAYRPYLDGIIEIIDPKVIVTLGRFSMGKFLASSRITSVHGKIFRVNFKGRGLVVVPMFHPAAALRSIDIMNQVREDFKKLPAILEEVSKTEKEENKVEVKQMSLV